MIKLESQRSFLLCFFFSLLFFPLQTNAQKEKKAWPLFHLKKPHSFLQVAKTQPAKLAQKKHTVSLGLDLNKATFSELLALPRIGKKLAQRILQFRSQQGGSFRSVEQLLLVHGIGKKTLHKLRPLVFVDKPSASNFLEEKNSFQLSTPKKKKGLNCLQKWQRKNKNNPKQPINLNVASLEQLLKLPCIGKKKAFSILQTRDSLGPFFTIRDVQKVHGISKKTASWIFPYVSFQMDLNLVSIKELEQIPLLRNGMGEAILEHRQKKGSFVSVENLLKVPGIGYASFEKLKKLFKVSSLSVRRQTRKKSHRRKKSHSTRKKKSKLKGLKISEIR